jgi:phosphohistidine phosphatase
MLKNALREILILRHAKAHPDESGNDKERELTGKGREAARRMGELAREQGVVPDTALCSTATRARETFEIFSEASGFTGRVEMLDELYLAPAALYVAAARRLGGAAQRLLVVGHNPGLEALVDVLSGTSETLPTSALAVCELPIRTWSELSGETSGKLIALWKPKEIG